MKGAKCSRETEERVLETLMSNADCKDTEMQRAFLKLTQDCFYFPLNRELFNLIKNCFSKGSPFSFVDILCLVPQSDMRLGDALRALIENSIHFHHNNFLDSDIEKLLTLSTLRKQLVIAEKMVNEVTNCPDAKESQELLLNNITKISNLVYREQKDGITNLELTDLFYEGKLEKNLIIPTTWNQLNKALGGGIRSKSLITIAADAGVGKTGFSIFFFDCIANSQPDKQVLFFSLEMEAQHIWERHTSIKGKKLFETMTEQEKLQALAECIKTPLKIYDAAISSSCNDIEFIRTTCRIKATEKPISVIVVDYLGLIENHGHFEREDLKQADNASKLARLAIELNCTVIALSQINRGASNRPTEDRCPYPKDAADSSGSYRSSTLWIGVDRPELYNDDPAFKNQFVIKCRKNRFGSAFSLVLAFNGGTFEEVPYNYFSQPKKQNENLDKRFFGNKYASNYD